MPGSIVDNIPDSRQTTYHIITGFKANPSLDCFRINGYIHNHETVEKRFRGVAKIPQMTNKLEGNLGSSQNDENIQGT